MNLPVGLRMMYCESNPAGIGKQSFKGTYEIIIKNLGHEKEVSVWVEKNDVWEERAAEFSESMTDNVEKWIAPVNQEDHEFAIKYKVNGLTYWDNNGGINYMIPEVHNKAAVVIGREFPVLLGSSSLVKNKLKIHIAVQNIAYQKEIGVIYTTDNWENCHKAIARYSWSMISGTEVWSVNLNLGGVSNVDYVLFYQVNGCEYWDNNFNRNYFIKPQGVITKTAENNEIKAEIWELAEPPKVIPQKVKSVEKEIEIKPKIQESELLPAS